MKKLIIYTMLLATLYTTGCKGNENKTGITDESSSSKKGSFTVDGTKMSGRVSTQYFGSNKEIDNFSVLCQQDEPLALLQATFANEKNAKAGTLVAKGGSYKVSDGEFGLELTAPGFDKQFIANDKSGGSLKVDGNKMTITDMKLFDADGKVKTVNATINF